MKSYSAHNGDMALTSLSVAWEDAVALAEPRTAHRRRINLTRRRGDSQEG